MTFQQYFLLFQSLCIETWSLISTTIVELGYKWYFICKTVIHNPFLVLFIAKFEKLMWIFSKIYDLKYAPSEIKKDPRGLNRAFTVSTLTNQSLTRSLLSENITPYRSPVFTTQTGNLGVLSMLPTWSVNNVERNILRLVCSNKVSQLPIVISKIDRPRFYALKSGEQTTKVLNKRV